MKSDTDEIDIVAVIKLPMPLKAFAEALKGLQKGFTETLYVRNCSDGYEIFKYKSHTNSHNA